MTIDFYSADYWANPNKSYSSLGMSNYGLSGYGSNNLFGSSSYGSTNPYSSYSSTNMSSLSSGFSSYLGNTFSLVNEADSMIGSFDSQMAAYGAIAGNGIPSIYDIGGGSYGATSSMSSTDQLIYSGMQEATQTAQLRNYYYAQGYSVSQVNEMIGYGSSSSSSSSTSSYYDSSTGEYDSDAAFWDGIYNQTQAATNPYGSSGTSSTGSMDSMLMMMMMAMMMGGQSSNGGTTA